MKHVGYKRSFYELTIAHGQRDGNIFIEHDHQLEANRDYKIFTEAGFMVILRKVTRTRFEPRVRERILKSQWSANEVNNG